jgi:hypothetical protein
MGDSKERIDHSLALKVMRLTRPSIASPSIVQSEARDITKDILKTHLQTDLKSLEGYESLSLGKFLLLPQAFGNIYLGETFSCYVCVHNDSTDVCRNVTIRADLQTATQRINLVPGQGVADNASNTRAEFAPGSTVDHVLNHEVKELGTHILVCEVTYNNATSNEKLNFRKFFKFQVMKPLDVKTKFYNAESDEVFLEAQVQNITNGTISIEKVALEPSHNFTVTSLNCGSSEGVFGGGSCLQSQDSWQYLFCLQPRPDQTTNNKNIKAVTNIGKLDIVWRSSLCDRGRLQTSQLQRLAPNLGDIKLTFISVPSLALLNTPVPLTVRITNNCERTVELDLSLDNPPTRHLTWTGVCERALGLVEPGGSLETELEVVLHDTGLQTVSGIKLVDGLLQRTYTFNDQSQLYVVMDEELYRALQ